MKKNLIVIALLAAVTFAFVGCDDSDYLKGAPEPRNFAVTLTPNQYGDGCQYKLQNTSGVPLNLGDAIKTGDTYILSGSFTASRASPEVEVQFVCDKWEDGSTVYTGHNKITGDGFSFLNVVTGTSYPLAFTFEATGDAFAAANNTLVFQTHGTGGTEDKASDITLTITNFVIYKVANAFPF
jgi:hypothetical protein